jgi:hypothetical protein
MSKIVRPTEEEGSCIGIPDVVVAMMTTDVGYRLLYLEDGLAISEIAPRPTLKNGR